MIDLTFPRVRPKTKHIGAGVVRAFNRLKAERAATKLRLAQASPSEPSRQVRRANMRELAKLERSERAVIAMMEKWPGGSAAYR